MIQINETLSIPFREIRFVATTGTGPGGQHVNRVATKVVLLWDMSTSTALTEAQRKRIQVSCATRINKQGVFRVVSSKHRSQKANKDATLERFVLLLRGVLKKERRRTKTRVSRAQKTKRLDAKKRRSTTKSLRKPPNHD
ncbi:MAG: alternative ribosome rescue aminoacyl-tRNA hydrolase ArfB [Phycisphaerales bacterium]|jgi:ribosome-associated protein|nr:alternative ribosome rescue aminoacyl-tRNA hydrolase ArfB [Phycisphaerales bacterium]